MARPLSEEKRDAILSAATDLVATIGVGAPTAKIAKDAGIAEGTLFVYFDSKDDLFNQLYLALKAELAEAMMRGYPAQGSENDRIRHVWDRFIDWGATYPMKWQAIRQLGLSDRVTEDSRKRGAAPFRDVHTLLERRGAKSPTKAPAFVGAILESLAETTLGFIAREPKKREQLKQAGFEILWNGIAG